MKQNQPDPREVSSSLRSCLEIETDQNVRKCTTEKPLLGDKDNDMTQWMPATQV